jgi:hypothetical protein
MRMKFSVHTPDDIFGKDNPTYPGDRHHLLAHFSPAGRNCG